MLLAITIFRLRAKKLNYYYSRYALALSRPSSTQPSQRNGLAELGTEYPVRVGADVGARIVTADALRTQAVLVPALNLLSV